MKNVTTLLLIHLMFLQAWGQVTRVDGVIFDQETGGPIPDVVVYLHVEGYPKSYTSPDGQFSFRDKNLGLDLMAKYRLTFYKPGYNTLHYEGRLPIVDPILLQKSATGYLQIISRKGKQFLAGIEVRHQGSPRITTDSFGFAEIKIPPNAPPDKEYSIAMRGGLFFQDKTEHFLAKDLKDRIISIELVEKDLDYKTTVEIIDEELTKMSELMDSQDNNPEVKKKILTIRSLVDHITQLQWSVQEEQDFQQRWERYQEAFNIAACFLARPEIEKLHHNYLKEGEQFMATYQQCTSAPVPLEELPGRFEVLIERTVSQFYFAMKIATLCPKEQGLLADPLKNLGSIMESIPFYVDTIRTEYPEHEKTAYQLELKLKHAESRFVEFEQAMHLLLN